MWILTSANNEECFILIHEKVNYTVGRAGADLVLSNDTSISRAHAVLHLKVSEQEAESLELEDSGSKYGTFHNDGITKNVRLKKGERLKIQHEDRIRFGLLNNVWSVAYRPLATMASSLPQEKAQHLEDYMQTLGGKMLQRWEAGCTHLTMSEVTITVKLLYALLEQLPIVTCEYWRDAIKAARRGKSFLPPADVYMPRRCEALMHKDIDMKARPERKQLFTSMTFVFMNRKHYDMYALLIEKAGGTCRDLNCGIKKTFLTKDNVVVVQYVPSTQSQSSQTIGEIEEFLQRHSRRAIPEYEIGLAIIYCSTEKYCNANYNILNDIIPVSGKTETPTVLVENTRPASTATDIEATEIFIPETIPETACTTQSGVPSTMSNEVVLESTAGLSDNNRKEEDKRMSNMRVTESIDTSQNKRKRDKGSTSHGNDDDDAGVAKKPHLTRASERRKAENKPDTVAKPSNSPAEKPSTSKAKTTPKSSARPLPIEMNVKRKSVTTAGFLEKGVRKDAAANVDVEDKRAADDAPTQARERLTRKRPVIGVISDDDDDLFSFGESTNKTAQQAKRTRVAHNASAANDSDDGLFGFTDMPKERVEKPQSDSDDGDDNAEDNDTTQRFVSKPKDKTALTALPKPKPQPKKISVDNWLCCSLNGMDINGQAKIKLDEVKNEVKDETDASVQQWLDTLKGGFEVRKRAMNLTTVRGEITSNQSENSYVVNSGDNGSLNNSKKNFKAFVKKNNAFPQHRVIATKPTYVSHLRLR